MNTYYIDCNKANSADKNNLDNSVYTTELKNSLTLPTGSEISIQSSFLNQKGITGSSIELLEDIEETIKFFYYKSDTSDLLPNEVNSASQNAYVSPVDSKGTNPTDTRMRLFNQTAGHIPDNIGISNLTDILANGACEQPLMLLDYVENAGTALADPAVGSVSIKIKKGIYGISQIADIITKQMNGQLDENQKTKNVVLDKIHNGEYVDGNLDQTANGLLSSVEIPATSFAGNLANPAIVQNQVYLFTDVNSFNHLRQQRISDNSGVGLLWANGSSSALGDTTAFCQSYVQQSNPSLSSNDDKYNPLRKQVYVGSPYFSLDYNSENSSFEIGGLHTPFNFQSVDGNYNMMNIEGKSGVYYKRLSEEGKGLITSGVTNNEAKNLIMSSIQTPISRIGGVIVHNWAFDTATKNMTKVNPVPADIPVVRNVLKFEEFFNTKAEAMNAWKKTIWSRLGFSYEQLNEDFEKVRYYNGTNTELVGTTTNTNIDSTIIQSISTRINISSIVPSGGSKGAPPTAQQLEKLNSGGLFANNLFDVNIVMRGKDASNSGFYTNSIYDGVCMYPVESAGSTIEARNLPTLSDIGYYLITSDILDGYNDIVKNGDPIALLGVVAKSSLSNQDFIYSNQDITNKITNEKIVNKIKIRFLNPDLTSPSLDPNSSVILRIDTPIQQPINNNPLVQEEEDNKKK